jgi:divalent metal cation (Fe/Co/Zn/Cd) transporter
MSSVPQIPKQDTFRRIQRIQTLTIVWMTVEATVSLTAAWMARSPALLAFGGDSAIELLSAIVVLWRFRAHADQEQSEKRAARIAAVLLFILAAYVAVASARTLLGYSEPKTTYVGIAVLVAAAAIMPWLAKEKRKLSAITGSAALRADAAESALCAYLALVALIGLGINAIWHIWLGRPDCCSCDCSAHLAGRMGSHARQSLWLLLIWRTENSPREKKSGSIEKTEKDVNGQLSRFGLA